MPTSPSPRGNCLQAIMTGMYTVAPCVMVLFIRLVEGFRERDRHCKQRDVTRIGGLPGLVPS